jgi:hypothetical protein
LAERADLHHNYIGELERSEKAGKIWRSLPSQDWCKNALCGTKLAV